MTDQTIFLVIHLNDDSLTLAGFEGRDEIEDPLHDALQEANFGEVTGGGGGIYGSNIDIEINAGHTIEEALALIRRTLQLLRVPVDTRITQYEPERIDHSIYD